MIGQFLNKRVLQVVAMTLASLLLVFLFFPCTARAESTSEYGSWIRDSDAFKNSTLTPVDGGASATSNLVTTEDPSIIESMFAWMIAGIGSAVAIALKATGIDASTTGVIMGTMTGASKLFIFDLTDNNIYGIAGATLYVITRTLALSFVFIFVTGMIISSLAADDTKGLSAMKQAIYTAIITIFLLYMMPQVTDWLCAVRDVSGIFIFNTVQDSAFAGVNADNVSRTLSLEDEYFAIFAGGEMLVDVPTGVPGVYRQEARNVGGTPNMANALIYTAICFLPTFYVVSYIRIALQELVLFGMFPIFAVLGIRDKKLLSSWSTVFFSNLFVPTIDVALISIPSLLLYQFGENGSLIKGLIAIVLLGGVIPVRNQILNMMGNAFGVAGGAGIMGFASTVFGAARAARDAFDMKHGKESGGSGDGGPEVEAQENSGDSRKDLDAIQQDLKAIPEYLGGGSSGMGDGAALGDIPEFETHGTDQTEGDGPVSIPEPASEPVASGVDGPVPIPEPTSEPVASGVDGPVPIPEPTSEPVASGVDGPVPIPEPVPEPVASGVDGPVPIPEPVPEPVASGVDGPVPIPEPVPEPVATPDPKESDAEPSRGMDPTKHAYTEIASAGWDTRTNDILRGARVDDKSPDYRKDIDGSLGKQIADASRIDPSKAPTPEDDAYADLNIMRAANLQTIDNLQETSAGLDQANMRADEKIVSAQAQIAKNEQDIDTWKRDRSRLMQEKKEQEGKAGGKGAEQATEAELLHAQERNRMIQSLGSRISGGESVNARLRSNIAQYRGTIAANQYAQKAIRNEVTQRQGAEKDMAALSKRMGHNDKTFNSAKEFTRNLTHESRVRRTANYHNAMQKTYEGILTPSERQAFARQQAMARGGQRAVAMLAAGAAAAGAGSIATGIAGLGGNDSAAQRVGQSAAKGIAKDTYQYAHQSFTPDAAEAVKRGAENGIRAVVNGTDSIVEGVRRRVRSMGGEKQTNYNFDRWENGVPKDMDLQPSTASPVDKIMIGQRADGNSKAEERKEEAIKRARDATGGSEGSHD